jgi:hypothetical protein
MPSKSEPTLAELCAAVNAQDPTMQEFVRFIKSAWAEIDAEQARSEAAKSQTG